MRKKKYIFFILYLKNNIFNDKKKEAKKHKNPARSMNEIDKYFVK